MAEYRKHDDGSGKIYDKAQMDGKIYGGDRGGRIYNRDTPENEEKPKAHPDKRMWADRVVIISAIAAIALVVSVIGVAKIHYNSNAAQTNGSAVGTVPDFSNTMEESQETTNPQQSPDRRFIFPNSDTAYLTRADLLGLTEYECCIARNEIYARRGYMFVDEDLQEYFGACDWYVPSVRPADFQDTMFNDYERKNVDLIVAYETEKGW